MPLDLSPPRLCIFDLDGTLVDSLRDIAESLNECLDLLGLPPAPIDDYRYMVGEGVPKLCTSAIGRTHPELVPRLIELARARYRIRPLRHTKPYPGICELVARISAAGQRLAVLSNKPHDMTARIVEEFWPGGVFARVQGYLEDEFRKPHPHYAHRICTDLGVATKDAWIIGDTPTDMHTAARAGIIGIGVTWGFRERPELEAAGALRIVDRPEEIA